MSKTLSLVIVLGALFVFSHFAVTFSQDDEKARTCVAETPTSEDAPNQKAGNQAFLSDLSPVWVSTFTSDRWGFGNKGFLGERRGGELVEILVKGKTFQHSLGTHPRTREGARIVYEIGGQFSKFRGAVALADQSGKCRSPITFEIRADGNPLWRSKPVQKSGNTESFDVDVQGVKRLELIVNCPGSNHSAGAVWLEPILRP